MTNKTHITTQENVEKIQEFMDEMFPKGGNISPVIILVNKEDTTDYECMNRIICTHCLMRLFKCMAQDYFVKCVEEGLIDIETGEAISKEGSLH